MSCPSILICGFILVYLDATGLTQHDEMSKRRMDQSADCTAGLLVQYWVFTVVLAGKKTNTTFCCHERSEIWSKLGATGEEFLEGHVSFTAIFNSDMKDAVLVSQMFEKSRNTIESVCKVAKMGLMV